MAYLPLSAAATQLMTLERHGTAHGQHFDFTPLLHALHEYVEHCQRWDKEQCQAHWCTQIGRQQRHVPAHVAHHYCDPEEAFDPLPTFKKPVLKRSLMISGTGNTWFPMGNSNLLGFHFALLRGGHSRYPALIWKSTYKNWGSLGDWVWRDTLALNRLRDVRLTELAELTRRLRYF